MATRQSTPLPQPLRLRRAQRGPQVTREGKERSRQRLRRGVPGQKTVRADPTLRHRFRLQERQHDVPAAEDERTRAVESCKHSRGRSAGQH